MTEMIERVAKAIEPKCRAFGQGGLPMQVAREFARAAIESMREPTNEMEEAGNSALSLNGVDNVEGDDSTVCFQAMIDAALCAANELVTALNSKEAWWRGSSGNEARDAAELLFKSGTRHESQNESAAPRQTSQAGAEGA